MTQHASSLIVLAAAIVLLAACEETPPAPANPNVAVAAYPTAQSVVDRFNAVTTSDPIDFVALLQIYHAEGPAQRRWRNSIQSALPVFDLATAVRTRFGEELIAGSDMFTTRPNGPAEITTSGDDRAEAKYVESNGAEATLYLVKVFDSWRVSGATYENTPLESRSTQQLAKSWDEVNASFTWIAPEMRRRVEAGDFATIADFRRALGEAEANNPFRGGG